MTIKSPLRYPGGKSRAVTTITSLIPEDVSCLVSPFLGGGSIELACAARGMTVKGFDIFQPLVAFWQYLLTNPEQLAAAVQAHYPLTKPRFYELQAQHQDLATPEQAVLFFVLNRASFSGTTLSGGCSQQSVTQRFTQSSIERLRNFPVESCREHFSVAWADYQTVLADYADEFMYLDPPYLIKSTLYGNRGSTHRGFDHHALAEKLKTCKRWILSYNHCPEILELYRDYEIVFPDWKYGMSRNKSSQEVLILNLDR